MTEGIHDISLMLGQMQSGIAEGIRQRAAIDDKLDKLMDLIPIVTTMRKELDSEIYPAIRAFQASRNRTAGIALGVGAGAGIGSAGLWPAIKGVILRIVS